MKQGQRTLMPTPTDVDVEVRIAITQRRHGRLPCRRCQCENAGVDRGAKYNMWDDSDRQVNMGISFCYLLDSWQLRS